jgi:hypothetical protein
VLAVRKIKQKPRVSWKIVVYNIAHKTKQLIAWYCCFVATCFYRIEMVDQRRMNSLF